MRGLFLLFVIGLMLVLGFKAPFVFILGYVWASIFTPQFVAYNTITALPISFIFAILAFASLFLVKRDDHIRFRSQQVWLLIFAVWMTMSLLWAEVPTAAFEKWDSAVKTVAFSALLPMFFKNRLQTELLIWVIVVSGIAHCIPFGAKVLLSGGGYGVQLGLIQTNSGFGEGSTIAMFAVMLIPLCMYLYKHQTIIPYKNLTRLMLIGFIFACVLTSVGTYARTGLVSMAALGFMVTLKSRHVFRNLFVVLVLAGVAYLGVDDGWLQRMTSISDDTESSAMGRVAVWKWVLEYIGTHPLGGSFAMYLINEYSMMLADGSYLSIRAKAYHSVYFEILGETGIPGFFMFVILAALSFFTFLKVKSKALQCKVEWLSDIAESSRLMLIVYMVGGLFIGVGFQVMFYYIVAISAILLNLLEFAEKNAVDE